MTSPPRPSGRPVPGLGPHLVGQRVVVRRVLPGETGPSGGPAMTDLLGVMETWAGGVTTIREESGAVTAIRLRDIVSGKGVPPRPSVRHRVSPEVAERRAALGWPAVVSQPLGEWLLRASAGYSSRANSVLAVGDPGTPFDDAVAAVEDFYRRHDLPPWAQVVVGGDVHRRFEEAGWVRARPGEADTHFQLASVSQALRRVRRSLPAGAPPVTTSTTAGPEWIGADEQIRSHGDAATTVLQGPAEVVFATVPAPDADAAGRDRRDPLAKGRAAYGEDWVGVSSVAVSPEDRRRGLARVVVAALLEWGAERGATTAYLQVRGDNPAALALYGSLGFATHHTYRYLTPG